MWDRSGVHMHRCEPRVSPDAGVSLGEAFGEAPVSLTTSSTPLHNNIRVRRRRERERDEVCGKSSPVLGTNALQIETLLTTNYSFYCDVFI